MRVTALLAAGAVVTGALTVTPAAAPPAQAAAFAPAAAATGSGLAPALRKQAPLAAPVVASRLAELGNAATGADLWSRSSVTERPIGSIPKVMTAYVVLSIPGVNPSRVI